MTKEKRVWFKPLIAPSNIDLMRARATGKPLESSEQFLVPVTWQGFLITVTAATLAYGAARLAAYLYTIKVEYGFAGWVGFVMIIIAFMHIANTFSNRP